MIINKDDEDILKENYHMVNNLNSDDGVLKRSLERFILGRRRDSFLDSIVDYVISLESILLTSNGSPTYSELSYRFALNGSSLFNTCPLKMNKRAAFIFMKNLYDIRSYIVHGSSREEIDKRIKKYDSKGVESFMLSIEKYLRISICWLNSIPKSERPYFKEYGWEGFLGINN